MNFKKNYNLQLLTNNDCYHQQLSQLISIHLHQLTFRSKQEKL